MVIRKKLGLLSGVAALVLLSACATPSVGPQARAEQARQAHCATQTGSMLANHCTSGVSSVGGDESRARGATSAQQAISGRQTSTPSAIAQ